MNKLQARVQLTAMFGMLDCAKNVRCGNKGTDCRECNVLDDENHRVNDCGKFKESNLYLSRLERNFFK